MDKLRKALSGDDGDSNSEEQGFAAQIRDASTFSWSTRIKGFIFCFILGFVFSIIGGLCLTLPKGVLIFSLFYTLGSITSMSSTLFLMGPWKQLKKMFNETRVVATILVVVFMVLTLVAAFVWKKKVLAIVFVFCQFLAMTWYSLSYIPYARDAVKKAVSSCVA